MIPPYLGAMSIALALQPGTACEIGTKFLLQDKTYCSN